MLGITIRMGAAHNSITTADGQVIDLSQMDNRERNKTRRILVGVYQKQQEALKGIA